MAPQDKELIVDPVVAYGEQAHEIAFLRNRNLVLAQQLAIALAEVEARTTELTTAQEAAKIAAAQIEAMALEIRDTKLAAEMAGADQTAGD